MYSLSNAVAYHSSYGVSTKLIRHQNQISRCRGYQPIQGDPRINQGQPLPNLERTLPPQPSDIDAIVTRSQSVIQF